MSAVDDRVVALKFDSSQFDANAQKSLGVLDKLKASLNFDKEIGALSGLKSAAGRFTLGGLSAGISEAGRGFNALSVVGVTALATIASKAVDVGLRVGKALTIDNIKAGFDSYNEQINATQIILANTAAAGIKLKDVNQVLGELQKYAQQTVYSFSEMTSAIGRFTAAGVPLKSATFAVKGLANAAALSGSNTQQLSSAYYQVSQALSAGTFKLQDWNSLVNANLGGKNIQNVIEATTRTMGDEGKAMDAAIKKHGDFRQSLQEGWLSSDIFNKSMKVFAGTVDKSTGKMRAFNVEELKNMGYGTQQAKELQKLSQAALDSATKIRTLPQLLQALKEELAGAYGKIFKTLFGDINQATKLFTGLHNVAENALTTPVNNLNKVLQGAAKMGARENLLDGLTDAGKNLLTIIKPIKSAFREIFPKATAKEIYNASVAFFEFAQTLKVSKGTADLIKRTFAGLFAVLDIGVQFVKALFGAIASLFGYMQKNSGGLLGVTASIGDFLVRVDDAVKKTQIFKQIFSALGGILAKPAGVLKVLGGILQSFFSNLDAHPIEALSKYLDGLTKSAGPAGGVIGFLADSMHTFLRVINAIGSAIKPAFDGLKDISKNLMKALSDSFAKGDFTPVYAVLNNLLTGGILLTIRKIFSKRTFDIDFGGGVVKSIKDTFGALTGTLKAMQTQIQAKTLLEIAGAVGILTASIVILSLIKTSRLISAMSGISASFAILLGAMYVLTKITGIVGTLKLDALVAAFIGLAVALVILAGAVSILAGLSWEELSKGLLGVTVLLGVLAGAAKLFDASKGGILIAAAAIIPLAAGLLLLSYAVKEFGSMSWEELAKGMLGISVGLTIIAGAVNAFPKDLAVKAAALIILATALVIMGQALQTMGGMSWESIAKAMVVLAGSLIILAAGLLAMEEALPGAAALIVAAAGLAILAPALQSFGNMSWESIAKSMVVLAGTLVILAVGLAAMEASIPGAAALLIASFAMHSIASAMKELGGLSWTQVIVALVALAGAFIVIGVAALVLEPLVPVIDALGAGIGLLGLALLAAGLGALAFATAFALLAATGTAGLVVLSALINLIPTFAAQMAVGFGAFVTTLMSQEGAIAAAFVGIAGTIIDALTALIPKIQAFVAALIPKMAETVNSQGPTLIQTFIGILYQVLGGMLTVSFRFGAIGAQIIVNFINGVNSRVQAVVGAAVNLITNFLRAIGNAGPRISNEGVKTIIKLANGMSTAIESHKAELGAAGRRLGGAIVDGLTAGIGGAASGAITAAINVAKSAIRAAKNALGIHSPSKEFAEIGKFSSMGLAQGLTNAGGFVTRAATGVASSAINTVRKAMSAVSSAVTSNVDVAPTITPVLDLSDVTKKAGNISGLLGGSTITPTVSAAQAASIAGTVKATADAAPSAQPVSKTYELKLEQTNNSPKALDAIEIYRNTKSQMSMLKEALKE